MDALELARLTVSAEPLAGHAGRSGALLETVHLSDGRSLVVKRYDIRTDIACQLLGDQEGVELRLFADGVLDALPPDLGHCLVAAWKEDHTVVLVMRDIGHAMFTWDDVLTGDQTERVIHAVASMHARFEGRPPEGLADLAAVVTLFAPGRVKPFSTQHPLMRSAWDGWSVFAELAPHDVAQEVLDLLQDPSRYLEALKTLPPTLVHADLATVNMALEDRTLRPVDWGMATAAPGWLDVGRLIANSDGLLGLDRDRTVAWYRATVRPESDDREVRLGLLGGLLWLGWNMALNAVDDAAAHDGRHALQWWTAQARRALDSDL